MGLLLLVAQLLLAAVFLVAGVAKLADLAGSRQALRDFGVPAALATPLGTLLPLAELAVAVALLPAASAGWGALSALVLLLLFSAGIGANLARGRTPLPLPGPPNAATSPERPTLPCCCGWRSCS